MKHPHVADDGVEATSVEQLRLVLDGFGLVLLNHLHHPRKLQRQIDIVAHVADTAVNYQASVPSVGPGEVQQTPRPVSDAVQLVGGEGICSQNAHSTEESVHIGQLFVQLIQTFL